MKKDTITFRIDQEKKKKLDAIATSMERDRAYVINEAVNEFLEIYQWQLDRIQKGIEQADKKQFASDEEVESIFKRWEQ